jgi:predicted dehydrogenase
MSEKLRYGVVGCGHLGRFHAEKIAAIENARLTAVFDIVPDKTTATAQQNNCRDCKNIDELLDLVDAVSIVVPTESHYAEAKRALGAGKHVLVEKPIAVTEAEGKELTDLAASQNLKLQVGHIERFNPAFAGLSLLPGPARFIEGHRLTQFSPRGLAVAVISELMIHDLDLLLTIVNSPVQDVHASAVAVVSEKPDIANARIEFANGSVANLTASRISVKKMRKLRLFAKDNYLSVDFIKMTGEHFVLAPLDDTQTYTGYFSALQHEPTGRKIMFRQLSYPTYDMLTEEIRSFVDAVKLNQPVRVDGVAATAALALANRIERIAMENLSRITT